MKNKLAIFLMSILILFCFLIVSIIASIFFSIKKSTSPIEITGTNNIAVIEIEGVILKSINIIEKLDALADEDDIIGVIFRINSPGGAVAPSQEIYQEILKLRKKKPVYASLGSMATSGGYYIASACQKIFSNPGTLTGSIGVIMNFINLKKLYEFLKIERSVIKTGKFKDTGAEYRAMNDSEKIFLSDVSKDILNQFTGHIKSARKINDDTIKLISDARILTGNQAKKLGLVDEIGTLNDAIKHLGTFLKLEDKPKIVYPLRKKEKFIDLLLSGTFSHIRSLLNNSLNAPLKLLPKHIFEVSYENN